MPTCKIRKLSLATAASLLTSALLYSPMISAGEIEYRIVPYLWTAGMDVEIGKPGRTTDAEVGFSDYLEFIDTGAAFLFDVRGEKWSFLANLLYVELSEDISLPAGTVDVGVKESIFEFAAGYRLENFQDVRILGGGRYVDLEASIEFEPSVDADASKDFSAPFIGLDWRPRQGKWEYYLEGDIGSGNDVDLMWQVALGASYHFSDVNAVSVGYRYLDIDYEDDDFVLDGNFDGILIGLMFKL